MRRHHVLLYVADVQVALQFYETKLGSKESTSDLPRYYEQM